jgi:hypothetical protein
MQSLATIQQQIIVDPVTGQRRALPMCSSVRGTPYVKSQMVVAFGTLPLLDSTPSIGWSDVKIQRRKSHNYITADLTIIAALAASAFNSIIIFALYIT